jgi:hypothetical protein
MAYESVAGLIRLLCAGWRRGRAIAHPGIRGRRKALVSMGYEI